MEKWKKFKTKDEYFSIQQRQIINDVKTKIVVNLDDRIGALQVGGKEQWMNRG